MVTANASRMTEKICNGHGPVRKPSNFPNLKAFRSDAGRIFPTPRYIVVCTYLNYGIVLAFHCLLEFLQCTGLLRSSSSVEKNRPGYTPLYRSVDRFFINLYRRFWDIWKKPIASVPGPYVDIVQRVAEDKLSSSTSRALNMGSYNYLGFAESDDLCSQAVARSICRYGAGVCSTRSELGTLDLHIELERLMAWYLGTEDSLVVGMGFATNSTCIPSLVGPGCLILSDELNHTSVVLGCRLSGATIRTFRHNDLVHLEERLTEAVAQRCSKWKKILIVVEGIYSMEGTIVNLPAVIRLKERFHAYLYLDEAHSIGAMGPNGRGVVDYFNCNPKDVDILMGTFTKSFGASGGYVAGQRSLIQHLRRTSYNFSYATGMAAPIAQQILEAIKVISGLKAEGDGARRLDRLSRNVRYFRRRLHQMGFVVIGCPDSPVVPLMLYLPANVVAFVRLMEERGVAVVCVCSPVVPFLGARVRFCLSAAHDRVMLDNVLDAVSQIGDLLKLKHCGPLNETEVIPY